MAVEAIKRYYKSIKDIKSLEKAHEELRNQILKEKEAIRLQYENDIFKMRILCCMSSEDETNRELNELRIADLNATQQKIYDNYDENLRYIDEQYEYLKAQFKKDPEKAGNIMEIMSSLIDRGDIK